MVMQVLRGKLERHSSTRHLVPSVVEDNDHIGQDLRRDLQCQQSIADALQEYVVKFVQAFEALDVVHQSLHAGGIFEEEELMPISKSLLAGFSKAHSTVRGVGAAASLPVETHRAMLNACAEDVALADLARSELTRYNKKCETLEDEEARRPSNNPIGSLTYDRLDNRLARNRDKLSQATHAAEVSEMRASDSLRACLSRKPELLQLGQQLFRGTADALLVAATCLRPAFPSVGSHVAKEPGNKAVQGYPITVAPMPMRGPLGHASLGADETQPSAPQGFAGVMRARMNSAETSPKRSTNNPLSDSRPVSSVDLGAAHVPARVVDRTPTHRFRNLTDAFAAEGITQPKGNDRTLFDAQVQLVKLFPQPTSPSRQDEEVEGLVNDVRGAFAVVMPGAYLGKRTFEDDTNPFAEETTTTGQHPQQDERLRLEAILEQGAGKSGCNVKQVAASPDKGKPREIPKTPRPPPSPPSPPSPVGLVLKEDLQMSSALTRDRAPERSRYSSPATPREFEENPTLYGILTKGIWCYRDAPTAASPIVVTTTDGRHATKGNGLSVTVAKAVKQI